MLEEFVHDCQTICNTPISGLSVCRVDGRCAQHTVTIQMKPHHYETFFCLGGQIDLIRTRGRSLSLGARDVLVVNDVDSITSISASGDLSGILVLVDATEAVTSLQRLAQLIGVGSLDTDAIRSYMKEHEGFLGIGASLWTAAVFANLTNLDIEKQTGFSIWKTIELFYLLSTHSFPPQQLPVQSPAQTALSRVVTDVATYMRHRLDERLTIDTLSTKFGISQTALKKEFRRLYGMPIHAWLQEQRLQQAALLLRETHLTVLDIAQEVGYSSTSQFSAAFQRRFDTTPGQYRKFSV